MKNLPINIQVKAPKILNLRIRRREFKTLDTSEIYSPNVPFLPVRTIVVVLSKISKISKHSSEEPCVCHKQVFFHFKSTEDIVFLYLLYKVE